MLEWEERSTAAGAMEVSVLPYQTENFVMDCKTEISSEHTG
jgi:hypothetical protein